MDAQRYGGEGMTVEPVNEKSLRERFIEYMKSPKVDLRGNLITAVAEHEGWEESAVALVDETIMPVIRQHEAAKRIAFDPRKKITATQAEIGGVAEEEKIDACPPRDAVDRVAEAIYLHPLFNNPSLTSCQEYARASIAAMRSGKSLSPLDAATKYSIAENITIEGRSKTDVVQDVWDEIMERFPA